MADQKITALTSLAQADIVSGTDVLPIVDVGAPSVTKKATPQAVVGASVNDLTQTWNNVATTFTAIKMNATDTASAAGSLLIDLQVGGGSKFSVTKSGGATISGNTTITGAGQAALTVGAGAGSRYLTINGANSGANGGGTVVIQNGGVSLGTFGNKSSLLGAGYDAQITFYSVNGFEWISSSFSTYMKLHNAGGLSLNGAANAGLGTLHAASFIKTTPKTVATLTAAATAGAGARDFVTDALAPTFGSAVTGGGAVNVPVYSTGAAWNVG